MWPTDSGIFHWPIVLLYPSHWVQYWQVDAYYAYLTYASLSVFSLNFAQSFVFDFILDIEWKHQSKKLIVISFNDIGIRQYSPSSVKPIFIYQKRISVGPTQIYLVLLLSPRIMLWCCCANSKELTKALHERFSYEIIIRIKVIFYWQEWNG